jgi:aldose 1-epimerase
MLNTGMAIIPAGLGWHPYFRLADHADRLSLKMPPVCHKIVVDDRMLPTGERVVFDDFADLRPIGDAVLDNCFELPNVEDFAVVTLKNEFGSMEYWQKTGIEGSNYVQVFTPPHRQSVAIEPMTCNVNAFRNGDGLVMLSPGTAIECMCGVEWIAG